MEIEELEIGDEVFAIGPQSGNFVVVGFDSSFARLEAVARNKDGSGKRFSLQHFENIPINSLRFVNKQLTGKLVKWRRDNLWGFSVGTVIREQSDEVEIVHPDMTHFTVNRNEVLEFKNQATGRFIALPKELSPFVLD